MPTWRVSEQLPATLGAFDLVILDEVRIPTKPAANSERKPATNSDLKPAGIPI